MSGRQSDRDYDQESRDVAQSRYAYSFDLEVMHRFMLRSFLPFLTQGDVLELGSYQGAFTDRLLTVFDHVTCVDASPQAVELLRRRLGGRTTVVNARIEDADLGGRRFDNVILTHVLEHLDDPVLVLRRIRDDWLSDAGRLLLVCPNANAPSRQIAVKMRLITHAAAVTEGEAAHGHRRTYSHDTLERDVRAAGLDVTWRSGIFFKALANFQWDRVIQAGIVSEDYLEGCYRLGQEYPDLCASIFFVCERGDS